MARSYLIVSLVAVLLTAPAMAKSVLVCQPHDNTARVLASPNPNDIHSDWSGESYVGLSTSVVLTGKKQAGNSTTMGSFLQGNIYSTRGGLMNKAVWIIAKEWRCERMNVKFDANGNIPMY